MKLHIKGALDDLDAREMELIQAFASAPSVETKSEVWFL
jgi:hypothetical protein